MKRRDAGVAVGVIAIVASVLAYRCHRGHAVAPVVSTPVAAGGSGSGSVSRATDPRTQPRGSISGTIRDDHGAPLAGARACATPFGPGFPDEDSRSPRCVASDARGAYRIADALSAFYGVDAMAPEHTPARYTIGDEPNFWLAPGEQRTGVDIVLGAGAVALRGTVSDVSGGPVARAHVRAASRTGRASVFTDTDDQGRFVLWLAPGKAHVFAVADGYARTDERAVAPGTVELLLTPEGSLSGTVIDAVTKQPRAGAQIDVVGLERGERSGRGSTLADERGAFRVARLIPGRYLVHAYDASGYGMSDGSVLVGLGQHVDGVVVRVHRSYQITGAIVLAGSGERCKHGAVDAHHDESGAIDGFASGPDRDGVHAIAGLLPGTYQLTVRCPGQLAEPHYPPVTIANADVTGQVWQVTPGATIRGHLRTHSGELLGGVWLSAYATTPLPHGAVGDADTVTRSDGSYALTGLVAARYGISVRTDRGVAPTLDIAVADGEIVERDIVLDDGGAVRGTVVDARGAAVRRVEVRAGIPRSSALRDPDGALTADDGTFELAGLAPGTYRVYAVRGWDDELRRPGTGENAEQGELVTVAVGRTASVRIVVEEQTRTIHGAVVDAAGAPIGDAYVMAAREPDAGGSAAPRTYWTYDERPALAAPDGTFEVTGLAPGKYTVRAYRKGGGEAIAEHVPTGEIARLQIQTTGSIEGTALGGHPDELAVFVRDAASGFSRTEQFYKSDGAFAVRDLPAGSYMLIVESKQGRGAVPVTLAAGEHKTGVAVPLDPRADLAGTLVELGTHTPVAAVRMFAIPRHGNTGSISFGPEEGANVTDAAGKFAIADAPTGDIVLYGLPHDLAARWNVAVPRRVAATAPSVELGEVGVLMPRIRGGEKLGKLGVAFKPGAPGEWYAERHEVATIDPGGPAAGTALKVGDAVVSVDGIDVTGANVGMFGNALVAPPGATLALGLERGVTVKITLR
jgi:carboxypeptidase family protein/PDZ domain-containing protein